MKAAKIFTDLSMKANPYAQVSEARIGGKLSIIYLTVYIRYNVL